MHVSRFNKDQKLQYLLRAGSSLYLKSGCLQLMIAPQFLEGVAWQADITLTAGTVHQVENGGWIQLHALQAGELHIKQASTRLWPQAVTAIWGFLCRGLRGQTWVR